MSTVYYENKTNDIERDGKSLMSHIFSSIVKVLTVNGMFSDCQNELTGHYYCQFAISYKHKQKYVANQPMYLTSLRFSPMGFITHNTMLYQHIHYGLVYIYSFHEPFSSIRIFLACSK